MLRPRMRGVSARDSMSNHATPASESQMLKIKMDRNSNHTVSTGCCAPVKISHSANNRNVWRPMMLGMIRYGFSRFLPWTRRAATSCGKNQVTLHAMPITPMSALSVVKALARPIRMVMVGIKYMPTLNVTTSPVKTKKLRRVSSGGPGRGAFVSMGWLAIQPSMICE